MVDMPVHGLAQETDVAVAEDEHRAAGVVAAEGVHDVWVQADFTENNLGNMASGDEVEIVFDALPGRVVRSDGGRAP